MAEVNGAHTDLAGYLLGALTPAEAADFELHLGDCDACLRESTELGALPELLAAGAPPFEVPAGLADRVLATTVPPPPRRRSRWRVLVPIATATATAAAVLVVAFSSGGDEGGRERYALQGGGAQVSATVQTTGVGREVSVRIDRLRDPRPDGLYELWFVAPDDRRGRPHRVSAGTFHPDDAGRGTVRLVAAADPATYTAISVTLEPADGNPRRQGPTVLRAVRAP
jgi:anti-sigma-K factor RskA